ncbi:hypothetical protein [Spiroplasma endosymbiont of Othius punctulatus]|uniref:hypothetical protein n=1 Tax=Spiroplasma endosymbiont of Othius punctulatus TaxID=3066289 RepID=UPI0030CFE061
MKNKHKFDGLYQIGCIINIAMNSIALAIFGFLFLFTVFPLLLLFGNDTGNDGGANIIGGFVVLIFMLILMLVYSVLSIISIVFSAKELKSKSTSRYVVNGVFGIITNLIGGILILCAEKEADTTSPVKIETKEETKIE